MIYDFFKWRNRRIGGKNDGITPTNWFLWLERTSSSSVLKVSGQEGQDMP